SLNELCNWKCPLPISLSQWERDFTALSLYSSPTGRGTLPPSPFDFAPFDFAQGKQDSACGRRGQGDEGQPLHNSFRFAIAYCLLPITYYPFPIAYYLLPIPYCLLPITHSLFPITHD
ncbi:hypothetical protein PMG25_04755, partial [Roseofilum sp. BLCC_M114]